MAAKYLTSLLALATVAMALPSSPASPLHKVKRSVTCLTVGATATATWTNSAGETCTFSGVVGSNYGENAVGGEYAFFSFLFCMDTDLLTYGCVSL